MATRRRGIAPGKDKRVISPSRTGTTHIPNYLKPTISSATDVSKQQGKKPASAGSAHNPTHTRRRSSDKTPLPAQKSRVSTNPSLRSSSFLGKTIASQRPVPGKNLKALTTDAGKHRSLYATPVSTVKKSSTCITKQETENGTSATKEQNTITPHENVENPNKSNVPEPETQPEDQESSIAEAEEQTVQVVSNNEKGADNLVLEDQEPLDIEQTEAESGDKDAKIVTAESSTVLEDQDAPLGIKTQHSEDKSFKSFIEETSSKQRELEEQSVNEINISTNGESFAGNPNEEVEVKEVKEVEVVEEEEKTLNKKDEADRGSEAQKSKETEGQEVVQEKKQESENAVPKQGAQGKKDSAVSNDVIEETASKLREERKNKVKALAGAFETVISLQETK